MDATFAPVGGHIAAGVPIESLGEAMNATSAFVYHLQIRTFGKRRRMAWRSRLLRRFWKLHYIDTQRGMLRFRGFVHAFFHYICDRDSSDL